MRGYGYEAHFRGRARITSHIKLYWALNISTAPTPVCWMKPLPNKDKRSPDGAGTNRAGAQNSPKLAARLSTYSGRPAACSFQQSGTPENSTSALSGSRYPSVFQRNQWRGGFCGQATSTPVLKHLLQAYLSYHCPQFTSNRRWVHTNLYRYHVDVNG